MSKRPLIFLPLFLLSAILLLSACTMGTEPSDSQAIAAAVEATLTAVAVDVTAQPSPQTTPSQSSQDENPKEDAVNLVLPPKVDGFAPAARPASAKGDPNAPVVIYEWSDYT